MVWIDWKLGKRSFISVVAFITSGVCLSATSIEAAMAASRPLEPYHFDVPNDDAFKFKVTLVNARRTVELLFKSSMLLPNAANGVEIPNIAWAEIGEMSFGQVHPSKAPPLCNNTLNSFSYEDALQSHASPMLLKKQLFMNAVRAKQYNFYLSSDNSWVVRCFADGTTCENTFSNNGWVSQFVVRPVDLCGSREMNNRLVGIISNWIK